MATHEIKPQQIEPLLEGMAILGTGGGGAPGWGKAIMENDFAKGRNYKIVDPEDIPDGATVVSGGIMGSVKEIDHMNFKDLLNYWEDNYELERAFEEMEKELGRKIDYIVPFEMGGLNTPAILSLGARKNIPIVNGDALGRAAPETQMTVFTGHGISVTPMPLVDHKGNVIVVRKADDPTYPDQIGRWMVTRGGHLGANNHYPMSGKECKESVIPKTITGAIALGEKIIKLRDEGMDPREAIIEVTSGIELFSGRIKKMTESEAEGFYFTKVELEGLDEDKKSSGELIVKNETMAFWKDNEIKGIFPDLICMLEPGTGRGLMSTELSEGLEIHLIGCPCHPRLRKGLDHPWGKIAFSSKRYGQEIDFIPIEKLNV